jgi:hypothetical protein
MRQKIYTLLIMSFLTLTQMSKAQQSTAYFEADESKNQKKDSVAMLAAIYRLAQIEKGSYQIQLGFGSLNHVPKLESEINELLQADSLFLQQHPVKISFNSPTYRLRLENFKTRLETEKASKRLRPYFKGLMIIEPGKNN